MNEQYIMYQILQFIKEYRPILILLLFSSIAIYLLIRSREKMPSFTRAPSIATGKSPEQRVVEAESEAKRLRKEYERVTLALAEIKRKQIQKELKDQLEKELKVAIPKKYILLDKDADMIGRPVYYLGGTPCIDIDHEVNLILERHPWMKPFRSIIRHLCFDGHTLYYWGVRLLSNGKWAVVLVSKKPRLGLTGSGETWTLKPFTKKYVLLTSQQSNIDHLIANKWEVVKTKAAIHLSATFLGPFPLDKWLELEQSDRVLRRVIGK